MALALCLSLTACSFIRDFDDFEVGDSGATSDSGAAMDSAVDGGADSGAGDGSDIADTSSPTDRPMPPTQNQFMAQLFDRLCEISLFCEGRLRRTIFGDLGQIFELACHPDLRVHPLMLQLLGIAVSDARYNPNDALACLEYANGLSCDFFLGAAGPAFGACRTAFEGNVAMGGECASDWDCVGDAYCDQPDMACGGLCTPRASAGQSCASANACTGELACVSGSCAARSGLGGICANNGHCGADVECPDGMWCPSSGACACRPTGGDECEAGLLVLDPCVDEFVCSGGATKNCVRGQDVNESCGPASRCSAGLRCLEGSCVEISGAGEPCVAGGDGGPGSCPLGFACAATGHCEPLPVAGQSCAGIGVCAIGVCGTGDGGASDVCVLQAEGAACSGSLECEGGCPAGMCAPLGGQDDPCSLFIDCQPGFACTRDNVLAPLTCSACDSL